MGLSKCIDAAGLDNTSHHCFYSLAFRTTGRRLFPNIVRNYTPASLDYTFYSCSWLPDVCSCFCEHCVDTGEHVLMQVPRLHVENKAMHHSVPGILAPANTLRSPTAYGWWDCDSDQRIFGSYSHTCVVLSLVNRFIKVLFWYSG